MPRNAKLRIALVAIGIVGLLEWCPRVFALDPSLDVSQYAHTAWKVRDGFTKGIISSVAQTPDGYLWLGTEFGLVRFDGVRTVPWEPQAGQRLLSNDITSLLATRDGTIWIGTRNGLAKWNRNILTIYPQMSGQWIRSLIQDREGTVWVGGAGFRSPSMLCAIRGTNVQCWGGDGMLAPGISGLYEDLEGNLWAGVSSRGLWRWKPGPPAFFSFPEQPTEIRGFAETGDGALLVAGAPGAPIWRFAGGRFEAYPLSGISQPIAVNSVLRDREGGIWIATADRGLVHVHQGRVDTFTQSDGLSGDVLSNLFEDREGNIWVVGQNGLDRFRAFAVPSVSSRQGLSNGFAWSVVTANDGRVWISTSNGLSKWEHGQVSVFGRRNGRVEPDGKLNGGIPHSLFQDSSGRIWAVTLKDIGYLENDRFIPLEGVGGGGIIRGIAEEPSGHIWLANQWTGLRHLFQGKRLGQIPWSGLGHPGDYAQTLTADPAHGGLWLGFFNGGVVHFADGKVLASYSTADGLGHGRVNDLRFESGGALWAATEGGLSRIHDGHIATLNSKNGLPCDTVHWSIEDEDHSVWLLLPCGLVRLARSELDAWVTDSSLAVKPVLFDFSDGVLSHAITAAETPRVARSGDGKIWFPTGDGVSIIDPRHLPFNNLPPPVHIEQLTADEKKYAPGLHLPPHTHYLSIDYTALSLAVPEKVRFRYRLEGVDPGWREVVNNRQVQYSNLGPGSYHFRVMACNNSGVWNEAGDSLDFSVDPAYYQTYWFLTLCVAAFLTLLWAVYQYRLHQIARDYDLSLDARVEERTRIARELHDTLLQSFQGLTALFGAARNMLPARPADAAKTLDEALGEASRAIVESRDAIQDIRSSTELTNELAQGLKAVGKELASESSAQFTVTVNGTSRGVHPILRDEIYKIAREALRNAFRHAHAQRIEAEIYYSDKMLRLCIRDDGGGFDPSVVDAGSTGHYGLRGMRERAARIGAKLEVGTGSGAGTEITVSLPGS
ncbi:MAG TPA: two-component regulator propeller domain-containing protein, partial [Silvibacterium sp.]|nr:two-component regulator propeller domain-containing protein [Silvibacterium sp.]